MNSINNELTRCKEIVEKILSENPKARNDDKFLVWKFWHDYDKVNIFIPFEDFCRLTPIESVTRARRLVQNKLNRWLPTCPDVSVKRRIREEQIKQYFSDNEWYISEWNRIKYNVK